jgi:hypothetical protein
MPTRYQQEQFRSADFLESLVSTKPLIHIRRRKWLHERSDGKTPCPCCGSIYAKRVTDDEYIDLLVSRDTGARVARQAAPTEELRERWDEFLEQAETIDIPFRCHAKQERVAETKVKMMVVSGGVGGGKSAIGANALIDEALKNGGPGSVIWWVCPELKHIDIALRKLFIGDYQGGRHEAPLFPASYVVSRPKNYRQKNLEAVLLDGTTIRFWHAGNEDHFKGQQPTLVVFDEGASVREFGILAQLRERTMRSGGRIIIPTTPVVPSPIQEVIEKGVHLDYWNGEYASMVWCDMTSYDNPWLPVEWVKDHLKVSMRGDAERQRREIMGEWVLSGDRLWSTLDDRASFRGGSWTKVEEIGLTNVTPYAARRFFSGLQSEELKVIAGQDFNLKPMSCEILQIAVPHGMDTADPKNWIAVFVSEVVEDSDIFQFCDLLRSRGYPGLAISCDPSGAFPPAHDGFGIHKSSTFALEMNRKGYECRPANRSSKSGRPLAPPRIDRVGIAKKLMYDRITAPDGTEWPRFLVHVDRCPRLVESLEKQRARPDGTMRKSRSGDRDDVLSGPTDAATYVIWSIFSPVEYHRPIKWET